MSAGLVAASRATSGVATSLGKAMRRCELSQNGLFSLRGSSKAQDDFTCKFPTFGSRTMRSPRITNGPSLIGSWS